MACTDAPFGELADVVVDPLSRRVTHVVVQPHERLDARLVPVERARPAESGIALDCPRADLQALEPLSESAYLRVGQLPVSRPRLGHRRPRTCMALPIYQDPDSMRLVVDT